MKRTLLLSLLALLFLTTAVPAAPSYHVISRIPVPGDGGWDYLTFDADTHRLYISRGNRVQVLDIETQQMVGEIPDTEGVHGIALAPLLGRGFTSNGTAGTVTVFDLKTLKPLQTIAVGKKPDCIIYDPTSSRVLTMNGVSHDCTVIDAATGNVAGTVPLGGQPEYAAVDDKAHVFVNLEDKSEVVELDANTLKLLGHWSLFPGDSPSGLAIDPKNHHLFIGCHNNLMLMFDTLESKIVGNVPIGNGVDANLYDDGLAFSSNGDGTLTVAGTRPYKVRQTVETMPGARTMALDPKNHRIFLSAATISHQPTAEERKQGQRPQYAPNSFVILVVGK